MFKDEAYNWLNANATMYRGNNASDCMVEAFIAGAKMMEEKFLSTRSNIKGDENSFQKDLTIRPR